MGYVVSFSFGFQKKFCINAFVYFAFMRLTIPSFTDYVSDEVTFRYCLRIDMIKDPVKGCG